MTDEPNVVGAETAAKLILVTPRHLARLVADGWIERAAPGRYHLIKVVHGYIKYLKDEGRRTSKSASESRLKDMRAQEVEMRVAQKRGELVSLDAATEAFDRMTGEYLQSLSSLPARVTRNVRERQRIEALIDSERQRISDRFAAIGKHLASGGSSDDPNAADDA